MAKGKNEAVEAKAVEAKADDVAKTDATDGTGKKKRKAAARKKTVDFPALKNEAGEARKIEALAELATYKTTEHKPLRPSHFADEGMFYEWRADVLEKRVKWMRDKAVEVRTLGSTTEKAKVGKLLKLRSKMAELEAALKGEGVDVEALLASLSGGKDEGDDDGAE